MDPKQPHPLRYCEPATQKEPAPRHPFDSPVDRLFGIMFVALGVFIGVLWLGWWFAGDSLVMMNLEFVKFKVAGLIVVATILSSLSAVWVGRH